MSKEIQSKAVTLRKTEDWLENATFRNALVEASPRDYNAIALSRAVLTMMKADSNLRGCTPQSLLNSVLICAQTGLLPGPMGMCALVAYKKECQWQLMFKGAVALAARAGAFGSVSCEVVHKNDFFECEEGSDPFVKFNRAFGERGEPIAAFCSIKPKGGGDPSIRVMGIEEIEKIRDQFDRGQRESRPWVAHFDEQACKTVLKRTLKRLPMGTELALEVGMDDLAEIGHGQHPDGPGLDDLPETPEGGFCNKDVGTEGLVCGKHSGHKEECVA